MSRLENFHVMFFASLMGLSGFVIAYEKLNSIVGISDVLFIALRLLVTAIFVVIALLYIFKIVKFKDALKKEIAHPIRINFFAAIPISTMLLALAWKGTALHQPLYLFGMILLTFLTFYTIAYWVRNEIKLAFLNPAWFIPIVGNLIVVMAADTNSGYLWYYYSVGVFFYIILFALVFYRLIFCEPLAGKFMPTLFIMIAPPALAFLGYVKLTESADAYAHLFLSLTLFFTFLIFFMYKSFLGLKFFLSWWAFTFPMVAATIAFLRAYEVIGTKFFLYVGFLTFAVLLSLIIIVSYQTILNILRKEICIEE